MRFTFLPHAALGKVVIRFPNKFSVYLHDTPNQKLFNTDKRFYSSGCVRVENALTMTELMFEDAPEKLIDGFELSEETDKPVNVLLPVRVPLMMVYWTAIVDENNDVRFRPDIYERDPRLLGLLDQP